MPALVQRGCGDMVHRAHKKSGEGNVALYLVLEGWQPDQQSDKKRAVQETKHGQNRKRG